MGKQGTAGNFGRSSAAATSDRDHARGPQWGESALQDLRFALRSLRKSPGFTATAVLTLALGIGANAAIFQLLDAVRLRSLPVANPRTLASIQIHGGNRGFGITAGDETLTYPLWEQIHKHQQVFSQVFAWANSGLSLGQVAQERRARGLWVSGEFFSGLGIAPLRGRVFSAQEDQPGCGLPGVVISYSLWQTEFGGRDSAIGQKLLIEDRPTEVIGITPLGFYGVEVGKKFDFALPFCSLTTFFPGAQTLARRDFFWLNVMGRLKPEMTLQTAAAQIASMSPGLVEATIPSGYNTAMLELYRGFRLAPYPGGSGLSELRKTYDESLWLLLGTTGLVLLIACANLANLMLARGSTREREMAVRLALGASRGRLIQQLLSEGLLLAVGGGVFGILLARVFSRTLVTILSTQDQLIELDLNLDWRVLMFTGLLAIATCVLFGLAPAFRGSRAQPGLTLKGQARGSTGGRERFAFQRMLVVSQIAVSLVLLVGALLFVRSFWKLMTIDPGFRQNGILIAVINLKRLDLAPERYENYSNQLLGQIRSLPEVESAAAATHVPFEGSFTSGVHVGGTEGASKFTWASPGYFRTMEIPLIAGRDFNERDTRASPRVAIVNESFVGKFFGGENPLGRTMRTVAEPDYPGADYEIVGVVKDTKYEGLREVAPPPQSFAPSSQYPTPGWWTNVFVRSSAPMGSAMAAVRDKLGELNPEIGVTFQIFQQNIEDGLVRERMMALLSGFFGALAALLAMIGLYGVISYIVAMRRNEIGIRMALGASRPNVVSVILRETLQLLVLGVVLGVLLALAATRGASSLLFGLQPHDPLTLIGASALLIAVAFLASCIPALRAARVDPMNALRYE
jgi:predicted permease